MGTDFPFFGTDKCVKIFVILKQMIYQLATKTKSRKKAGIVKLIVIFIYSN